VIFAVYRDRVYEQKGTMGEMWLAGRTARMCAACGKQEGESWVINGMKEREEAIHLDKQGLGLDRSTTEDY